MSTRQILKEFFPDIYEQIKDDLLCVPAELTEREQEVYRLRVIENLTLKDVADRLGISISTVATYIKRIKAKGVM